MTLLNKMFSLMKQRKIDTSLIDINGYNYFTDEMIMYIYNLAVYQKLPNYQLEGLIYLTNKGYMNSVNPKDYYKIIASIKETKNSSECYDICENFIEFEDVDEAINNHIKSKIICEDNTESVFVKIRTLLKLK